MKCRKIIPILLMITMIMTLVYAEGNHLNEIAIIYRTPNDDTYTKVNSDTVLPPSVYNIIIQSEILILDDDMYYDIEILKEGVSQYSNIDVKVYPGVGIKEVVWFLDDTVHGPEYWEDGKYEIKITLKKANNIFLRDFAILDEVTREVEIIRGAPEIPKINYVGGNRAVVEFGSAAGDKKEIKINEGLYTEFNVEEVFINDVIQGTTIYARSTNSNGIVSYISYTVTKTDIEGSEVVEEYRPYDPTGGNGAGMYVEETSLGFNVYINTRKGSISEIDEQAFKIMR